MVVTTLVKLFRNHSQSKKNYSAIIPSFSEIIKANLETVLWLDVSEVWNSSKTSNGYSEAMGGPYVLIFTADVGITRILGYIQ